MNILNGLINLFRFDKTNWKAVALCHVAAMVFWFFNALNKEHTATISIPVNFEYNRAAFTPVKSLPQKVLLNITGSGWDLLRKSVGFKVDPLLISLDKPADTKKLPPSSMLALAVAQFSQLKINHVASDTLMIYIERRKTKKIKLFVSADQLKFKNGFGLFSGIYVSPDSISLEGPTSILSQIPDSIQLNYPNESIDEDANTEVDIQLPVIDGVTLSNSNATVRFKVDKLIEATKRVKIVVLPFPPYRYQLFTDSVSVVFRIPSILKDSLRQETDMYAVIDLQKFEAGTSKIMPVIRVKIPFGEVIQVDSVMLRKY